MDRSDRFGHRITDAAGGDQLAHLRDYRLGIGIRFGGGMSRSANYSVFTDGRRRGGRRRSAAINDRHANVDARLQRLARPGDIFRISAFVADLSLDFNRFGRLGLRHAGATGLDANADARERLS